MVTFFSEKVRHVDVCKIFDVKQTEIIAIFAVMMEKLKRKKCTYNCKCNLEFFEAHLKLR